MARFVVTGGAGFIGSHLVEALIGRGDEVVALDDLSTGAAENLAAVDGNARFEFVEGSVLDAYLVDDIVSQADFVVHLAAAVGVALVMSEPLRSFMTNLKGTENVVEAASHRGTPLLIASSSEVYGDVPMGTLSESSGFALGTTQEIRWSYAVSKIADEVLAFLHHIERGLPAVIVRPFNTVGPRQSAEYGMVLPRLTRQALAGDPLTVYGDGTQTRCFCHVDDVVRGLLLLADDPRSIGGIFNIGSTEEVRIIDVARRILDITDSNSRIDFVPFDEAYGAGFAEIVHRVPDISEMTAKTGWAPSYRLDAILQSIMRGVLTEAAA